MLLYKKMFNKWLAKNWNMKKVWQQQGEDTSNIGCCLLLFTVYVIIKPQSLICKNFINVMGGNA